MDMKVKAKMVEQKHKALRATGTKPPRTPEENRRRAKEAHGY